jgi:hypothetical protein
LKVGEASQSASLADETRLLRDLKRDALWSLAGYAVFLLPTLLWLLYCLPDIRHLASASPLQTPALRMLWENLVHAWRAEFWHFPGLNAKNSRLVLDILRNALIGWQGWLFYRSYRRLASFQTLSGPSLIAVNRGLWIWFLFASLLLIAVIPFHSTDLYGYLNRGFQQSLLGTNPYLTPIADIPQWQRYPYLQNHWIFNPCPYGFVFAEGMRRLTEWTGPNLALAALAFKVVNGLFLALSIGCVGILAKQLRQPRPWLSVFLVAANPLVLLHALGNGHNDVQMLAFLLLALCCLQRQDRQWLAFPILMLSILVKYLSLLTLPFFCIYLWRQKAWRALLGGLAVAVLTLVLFATPYLPVEGQVFLWQDMLDNAGKPEHSLLASLSALGGNHGKLLCWGKTLFTASFLVLGGTKLIHFWRQAQAEGAFPALVKVVTRMLMALILVASAKFHPWYIVMFLPLAVLLPEDVWLRRLALTLGLVQLVAFTGLQNIPILNTLLLLIAPAFWIYKGRDPFLSEENQRVQT